MEDGADSAREDRHRNAVAAMVVAHPAGIEDRAGVAGEVERGAVAGGIRLQPRKPAQTGRIAAGVGGDAAVPQRVDAAAFAKRRVVVDGDVAQPQVGAVDVETATPLRLVAAHRRPWVVGPLRGEGVGEAAAEVEPAASLPGEGGQYR